MKKSRLFFTILCLFFLQTLNAQQWYEHNLAPNYPYPNFNSVCVGGGPMGIGSDVAVGDAGYIGIWSIPVSKAWYSFISPITTINLNSVYVIDSLSGSNKKTFVVGNNGLIIKANDIFSPYLQHCPVTSNLYSVFFTVYSNGIAVGDAGTIVRTTDGGSHWALISNTNTNRLYSVHFPSSNIGYAVGVSGTVIRTTDNGQNWIIKNQPITDSLRCVWFTTDNTGFVVSRNGAIYKTTNGGDNWQSKPSGTTQNLNAICFESSTIGYAAGNNNILLRTTDSGETWTTQTLPTLQRPGNFKSVSAGYNLVYAVGSNGTAIGNMVDPGAINENFINNKILLTPNPAKDKLSIKLQDVENLSGMNLSVCNMQGQILLQQNKLQNENIIDISQLPIGIYTIKVTLKEGIAVSKFVKE